MTRECQRGETIFLHCYSQFFFEFANEALLGAFSGFDLAAGKLPQAGHRLTGRSLRNQDPAIGVDQSAGGDEDKLDGHGFLIGFISQSEMVQG